MKSLTLICLVFAIYIPVEANALGDILNSKKNSGNIPSRSSGRSTTGNCQIRNSECINSGSPVQIDLTAQCMCVGTSCFEVSIGRYGPNQTRNGTGRIGSAPGKLYRTRSQTSTSWDNDAVSMGIPQNDGGKTARGINLPVTSGGKWIHKVGQTPDGKCITPAASYVTAGCVGVPCDKWPKVKGAMGQSLTVCGGARSDSEIVSVMGCKNRRYCSRDQSVPQHLGCKRAIAMATARGRRVISCNEETNTLIAEPPFPAPPRSVTSDYDWRSVN